ncbi:MAG: NAD-dependent epimerase/dehydratase family protein [Elusimicrobia bacterium]|nr:NAD-dependent epimerase/dehydratase family protein [Elusimicrobiota bacterium]
MNVLVTGGAGLIGSSLCRRLLERGDSVVCVDDFSLGTPRHVQDLKKEKGFRLEKRDVAKPGWHKGLKGPFELVVHLAANSDISTGRKKPEMDLERTLLTTFETLQAARALRARGFAFASSSAVYGYEPVFPTPESAPRLHPVSVYGAGKLASEAYISAFVENYGLNAWVYRFGNVVGRRLTHGAIYDFVAKLRRDPSKLEVLGDGRQRKTYIDVEDCVSGILHGVAKSPAGKTHAERFQVFNLSTDGATSVREIAEEAARVLTGGKARIQYGESPIGWVGDVPRTSLDVAKLKALGWAPKLDSLSAVRKSVADYAEWSK